jgi:protein-L-isoaspartate O-methyltransferase
MSPAAVQAAREAGALVELGERGFMLCRTQPTEAPQAPRAVAAPAEIDAMRASLKAGITVAAVPQLFPTPIDVAEYMVELAGIEPGQRVLEPSAGTGSILGAMGGRMFGHNPERGAVVAVEINRGLADRLAGEFPLTDVRCTDFLACNGDLGKFDRILMNPPFENGSDIGHILHAYEFLKPGGRLVAICADGPRQQRSLKPLAESTGGIWEPLPIETFKNQGTGVRTALLVIEAVQS